MRTRSVCSWRNRSSKSTAQSLPAAFAAYRARSASLSIWVAVAPAAKVRMPALPVTCSACPFTATGRRSAVSSSSPRARTSPAPTSGSSTPNSSPPGRASTSPGCSSRRSRSATASSRSSPNECPSRSLTSLKPSRSSRIRAPVRPAAALICSSSRRRLGSPVSVSANAVCRSDSCRAACSSRARRSEAACRSAVRPAWVIRRTSSTAMAAVASTGTAKSANSSSRWCRSCTRENIPNGSVPLSAGGPSTWPGTSPRRPRAAGGRGRPTRHRRRRRRCSDPPRRCARRCRTAGSRWR
jgi:hypothetical protein